MSRFIAMTIVALASMLAGCEYFIPSFAGHGGGGMKEYAEISISVADMDVSLPFYRRLGFDVIEEDQKPHRRIIVSDGQIFLRLEQTSFDSPRLVYISSEAADRAERLQRMGIRPLEYRMPDGGTAKEFKDPNGIVVVLRHGRHPARKAQRDPQIGIFGEVSIETNDVPRSMDFWKKLGFRPGSEHRRAALAGFIRSSAGHNRFARKGSIGRDRHHLFLQGPRCLRAAIKGAGNCVCRRGDPRAWPARQGNTKVPRWTAFCPEKLQITTFVA